MIFPEDLCVKCRLVRANDFLEGRAWKVHEKIGVRTFKLSGVCVTDDGGLALLFK